MDLSALVRRDHDDLDRALSAMTGTAVPVAELRELLDVLQLALAVHIVAEGRVLDRLREVVTTPRNALRWVIAQVQQEHAAHRAAAEELAALVPGTAAWHARVVQLRIDVLDHATRADLMRRSFEAHVPLDERRVLASCFATERMKVLSATCPMEMTRTVRVA